MTVHAYAYVERTLWRVVPWVIAIAVIGSTVWAVVYGISDWKRGIYAGMHANDAQAVATNALIVKYGKNFTATLRFANPKVVNTHFNNALMGTGQVRVFHLIGQRGMKYCVSTWNPRTVWTAKHTIDIGGSTLVRRGCKF